MTPIHGECKTPGGKLVVVDAVIAGDMLTHVRVHGDFFINPEPQSASVLIALAASLHDVSITSSNAALEARLRAAIPFGVDLLGTSPEAIATAVRRAIAGYAPDVAQTERFGKFTELEVSNYYKRWSLLPWRLLPERAFAAAMNTALDEVLLDSVIAGGPPVLRFWRWSEPAVIVGRCQSVANEVDLDAASGLAIVRRITGGGAMFLQPHGAITYSLIVPEHELKPLSLHASYEVCDAWVIRALRSLGVDAHHVPINDIACSAGKIGGAAQARRGGVVLHHTTLAYDMDPAEMARVLRIGREKLKKKGVASAAKRVSPLVAQTGLSREAISNALFASFESTMGGTRSELTSEELAAAERLVETKFGTNEWTRQFEA